MLFNNSSKSNAGAGVFRFIVVTAAAAAILCLPLPKSVHAEAPPPDKSIVLLEAQTGKLLSSVGGDNRMPTGTLVKIMTALLVAEAIESEKLSPDSVLTASPSVASVKGAVIWLEPGEKMSVPDLLLSMMTGNANDAAIVLAESVAGTEERFVAMMNSRAAELELENTFFVNCTGLDADGQYSCAHDMAVICAELVRHEDLYPTMTQWRTFVRGGATELVNSNELVKNLNGIIGIKASKTEASGNCLALASKRGGECYISVCLGYSEKDEMFSAAKRLIASGFAEYSLVYPIIDIVGLSDIPVRGGTKKLLKTEAALSPVCIKNANEADITSIVVKPCYVSAPIKRGCVIGSVALYAGETFLGEIELQASENIEKMTVAAAFPALLETLLK